MPERVARGGSQFSGLCADGAVGVDGEVNKLLLSITSNETDDLARPSLTSLGISGEYLVADLDVLDGFAGAVGHHDECVGRETVASSVGPFEAAPSTEHSEGAAHGGGLADLAPVDFAAGEALDAPVEGAVEEGADGAAGEEGVVAGGVGVGGG